jgi:tRNA threonylcarbamoyladenosine biosynthesis protein TsaE
MIERIVFLSELEAIAADFISRLEIGDVVYMEGDLGAGKTTFVRAAIQSVIGLNESVPSPTFTLVQTYEDAKIPIWHYDLYRIVHPAEILELDMEEAFSRGITFIEWPNRMLPLYNPKHYIVELEIIDSNRRSLKLFNP